MNTMPILSRERFYKERESDCSSCAYLPESILPLDYMSDYSILGLLVDELPSVIEAIQGAGIAFAPAIPDQEIVTLYSRDFLRAVELLREIGIAYDVTDVVHGIYQG